MPLPGRLVMRKIKLRAVAIFAFLLLGHIVVFASSPASNELIPIKIGHLISKTGTFKDKGEYAAMGSLLALEEANVLAGFFGKSFTLVSESYDQPEMAAQKAVQLIQEENVIAIVGNVDDEPSLLISEVTQMHGIPFFNCASIADNLRGVDGHRYTFHIEASASINVSAIGQWLIHKKNLTRWYFLTDDFPRNIRIYEQAQSFLKRKEGVEIGHHSLSAGHSNYRYSLKKIKRANPEAVFVILNSENQINFLKQYKKSGLLFQVVCAYMDIVELWKNDTTKLTGVWPTIWYHELFRYSARELNNRFFNKFNKPMESVAWANWAAVKMISEAVIRSKSTEGKQMIEYLENNPQFDGHKGSALTFRASDHQLKQPLHLVTPRAEPGKREWDILKTVTPVPIPGVEADGNSLETLGLPFIENRCQLEPL